MGIGKSLAIEVAKRGANITLLARNQVFIFKLLSLITVFLF